MISRSKIVVLGLLVTLLMLGLTGCGGVQSTEPPETAVPTEVGEDIATEVPEEQEEPGQDLVVVRFGSLYEPDRLDNQYVASNPWDFKDPIWEAAIGSGPGGGEPTPRLAREVKISEDGLTYTFHLYDGITWSDGETFDSSDYVEFFDWITELSLGDWYLSTRDVVSWEALDDLTFQYTLSTPNGSFYGNDGIFVWPLPMQVYGGMTEDEFFSYGTDLPLTTGPIKITEWERGSHIVLDARPEYHLGQVDFDRVVWQVYSNWDALISGLLSGEIDVIPYSIPPEQVEPLAADPNITIAETTPGSIVTLLFNMSDKGLQHPAVLVPLVREAIDYALNRQRVIDIALLGHGTHCPPLFRCGPPQVGLQDPTAKVAAYDPEKANQMLEDAGYVDTDGDSVRESPDGLPLEFRLQFDLQFPPNEAAVRLISDDLKAIGFATEVEAVEYGVLANVMMAEEDYDLVLMARSADADPTSNHDWRLTCWSAVLDASGNFNNYCNKEFDALVQKVSETLGEERQQYAYELDRMFARERPYLYVAGVSTIGAYRNDRVEIPHDLHPDGGYLWSWWGLMNMEVK